ncbi:MAG TPA: putative ABC exporter domain-containing protein [Thermoanaerobaculia bacterium]|nr:putative ABC exporter domain-containing protein [Thermoanaerobaculia bacterium]
MNRALLELLGRSLRGRILRRARLLKQPKQLLGFVVGLAYFGWVMVRPFLGSLGKRSWRAGVHLPPGLLPSLHLLAALAVALLTSLIWLLASSKPALRLTETEIHLLLPAPLSRRQVLEYALLKQQPGILLGALVTSIYSAGLAHFLPRLAIVWALLTLVDLHLKGVSLWKARMKELPAAAALRWRSLAAGFAVVYWTATAIALWNALTSLGSLESLFGGGFEAAVSSLAGALRAGPLPALLTPFLLITAPVLGGPGLSSRLAGGLFLFALVAAHYEWVVRANARFEEAALDRARRQAAHAERRRRFDLSSARARRRQPFPLPPAGRPEIAIWWKNLMLGGRRSLRSGALWTVAVLALLTAGFAVLFRLGTPPWVAWLPASTGLFLLGFAPPFAGMLRRNDLRFDLLQVEILRPWPIPGWRLVAAELLAPATAVLWTTLVGAGLVLGSVASLPLAGLAEGGEALHVPAAVASAPAALAFVAALLLAGMPLALVSIALQNVAALLLPGWVPLGMDRRRGPAAMGQHVLVGLAQLLGMAVAAILPALAVLAAATIFHLLLGIPFTVWELPLFALVAAFPLLVETALLVRAGGALWDRLDPSMEILATRE